MSSKLFVYGVNARCPREALEGEFARCGEVTDVYITEKGYAFVTMADENGAEQAIKVSKLKQSYTPPPHTG